MLGPAFDFTLVRHAQLPNFHDTVLCLPANKLIVNMVDNKSNFLFVYMWTIQVAKVDVFHDCFNDLQKERSQTLQLLMLK